MLEVQNTKKEAFYNDIKFHKNTERYQHVTTADYVPALKELGYELYQVTQGKVRKAENNGFQRHIARFRSVKDFHSGELNAEIVIINQHMGTGANIINLGHYRTYCANGVVVGDTFQTYRIRHVGEVKEQINTILPLVAARVPDMIEFVGNMKSVEMTGVKALEFAEAVAKKRLEDREDLLTVDFGQLLTVNREADKGNDLYTVYNRVQENMFRTGLQFTRLGEDGQIKNSRTRKVRENSLAYVDINRMIWDVAAEFVG